MMHSESIIENLSQLFIPRPRHLFLRIAISFRLLRNSEKLNVAVLLSHISQSQRRFQRGITRMNEYHNLLVISQLMETLLIADLVHLLLLNELTLRLDADEGLRERNGSEAAVEEEKSAFRVDV